MTKAAQIPWRMEHTREGSAAVFGANGALVGVMSEANARLVVEAVNSRMEAERIVYAGREYAFDVEAIVRGAYRDDTL